MLSVEVIESRVRGVYKQDGGDFGKSGVYRGVVCEFVRISLFRVLGLTDFGSLYRFSRAGIWGMEGFLLKAVRAICGGSNPEPTSYRSKTPSQQSLYRTQEPFMRPFTYPKSLKTQTPEP